MKKKTIRIIKNRLTRDSKTAFNRGIPLGLCGILLNLAKDEKISGDDYDFMLYKLREKKKQKNTKFWDAYGVQSLKDDQFMWPPYEYKNRWKFLNDIQKELKD